MNFFEAQELARRRTRVLVVLFILAVLAITAALYLVLLVTGFRTTEDPFQEPGLVDPGLMALAALGTGIVVGIGTTMRTLQLRKGGPAVARLLGGREVTPDTRDPHEKRLVNVVEEMSIASGTPVPSIYVLDHEESINAFAAGHSIHDAAVAVTRGTLESLDRDELQGVVAHEFSHILNGDMRLNVRLIGVLFGILLLAVVGRGIMRGAFLSGAARGGRRQGSDPRVALLGVALLLLGYIGVLFGKLIKAAISRQREYLADAAAVQFTRNPDGLAGALRKIGSHSEGSRIRDHHAEELSHLFFANGLSGSLSRAFATHPPLEKRIRAIDPHWDGSFEPETGRRRAERKKRRDADAGKGDGAAKEGTPASPIPIPGMGARGGEGDGGPRGGVAEAVTAAAILVGSVGSPGANHVRYARKLLEDVPEDIRRAAHDSAGAQALVLLLLGGDDEATREARQEAIRELGDDEVAEWVETLRPLAGDVPEEARLPLVDLALPALHQLSHRRTPGLRSAAQAIIQADGRIRPFDFALSHILWRHLPGPDGDGERRRAGAGRAVGSMKRLAGDLEVVLSALARAGDRDDEAMVAKAFQAAVDTLPDGVQELRVRPQEAADLHKVDDALTRLEQGTLEVRRQVLEACAAAVLVDGGVDAPELELLRAVAEALDLPLPPLMAGREDRPGSEPEESEPSRAG